LPIAFATTTNLNISDPTQLGHFYDGGAMAVTQNAGVFSAYYGVIDVDTDQEARIWTMPDVTVNRDAPVRKWTRRSSGRSGPQHGRPRRDRHPRPVARLAGGRPLEDVGFGQRGRLRRKWRPVHSGRPQDQHSEPERRLPSRSPKNAEIQLSVDVDTSLLGNGASVRSGPGLRLRTSAPTRWASRDAFRLPGRGRLRWFLTVLPARWLLLVLAWFHARTCSARSTRNGGRPMTSTPTAMFPAIRYGAPAGLAGRRVGA